jgi:hypothetical protein
VRSRHLTPTGGGSGWDQTVDMVNKYFFDSLGVGILEAWPDANACVPRADLMRFLLFRRERAWLTWRASKIEFTKKRKRSDSISKKLWEQGCQMACFHTKTPSLGKFLEGFAIDEVGIFYGQLEYLVVLWYILWQFWMGCGHLVNFPHFGRIGPRKIWQPWLPDFQTENPSLGKFWRVLQ